MFAQNVHSENRLLVFISKYKNVLNNCAPRVWRSVFLIIFAPFFLFLSSCGENPPSSSKHNETKTTVSQVKIPEFNADSAYYFVKKQLGFGPRVPMTKAHDECALWMETTLKRFSTNVIVQDFKSRIYDGRILDGKNIVASFNPQTKNRIFLSSHWDSRPFADQDPDPANKNKPIAGANDGASGTGILLEIARQLSLQNPAIGIDIILFDLEDFGPPEDKQTNQGADSWGLGSQYWSKNPHIAGYTARFGILLDMVGAPNARFPMEAFSMYYAPDVVKKVWELAKNLGYGDYFVYENGGYITDDHYFINQLAQIPTIDIIHLDPNSANGTFYDHWHTVNDDLSQIDPATLKVVGQTLITLIYKE